MPDYASFRQKLDAVLRTLDVQQVSKFLIAENQWDEGTPADPEYAMWMMIAGSQTLRDLHDQARRWLISHGHEEAANAVLHRSASKGPAGSKNNYPKKHHPQQKAKGKRG